MAGIQAVYATLKALRDGTKAAGPDVGLPDAELVKVATRSSDFDRWTKDFLGG